MLPFMVAPLELEFESCRDMDGETNVRSPPASIALKVLDRSGCGVTLPESEALGASTISSSSGRSKGN